MGFPGKNIEWVAISSSRGSSWPKDQTCVSCIAGRCFTTEPPGKPLTELMSKFKQACIPSAGEHPLFFFFPCLASRGYVHFLVNGSIFKTRSVAISNLFSFLTSASVISSFDSEAPASIFPLLGPLWLHWVHPGQPPHPKSFNHICKVLLKCKIFTCSEDWEVDTFGHHFI